MCKQMIIDNFKKNAMEHWKYSFNLIKYLEMNQILAIHNP